MLSRVRAAARTPTVSGIAIAIAILLFMSMAIYSRVQLDEVNRKISSVENKIELAVSDEVMAERKAKWVPRQPKVTTGYLARYASLVTSGNRGAVLEIPR